MAKIFDFSSPQHNKNKKTTTAADDDDKKNPNCHRLPCTIHHFGPAPVSTYFESIIEKSSKDGDGDNQLTASFRGRPLNGSEVQLPDGYKASFFSKETSTNTFERQTDLAKVTTWELDRSPDRSPINKALQWIQISAAIHGTQERQ